MGLISRAVFCLAFLGLTCLTWSAQLRRVNILRIACRHGPLRPYCVRSVKKEIFSTAVTSTPKVVTTLPRDCTRFCENNAKAYEFYCWKLAEPLETPRHLTPVILEWCDAYRAKCNATLLPPTTTTEEITTTTTTSTTTTTTTPSTTTRKLSAEEKFRSCCANDKQLLQSCKYLCDYANINREALIDTFLRQNCPGRHPRLVLNCASLDGDHRSCCIRKGIDKHHGGLCMPLCNPTMRGHIGLGIDKLPCLDILPKITQCYREGYNRS